jgi:aspartate aminotransferase-like enzyme
MGLVWAVYQYARGAGRTHLFISAVTGRLELYDRLGFEPLGPAVACGAAAFVPMRVSLDRVERLMGRTMSRLAARTGPGAADPVCLLPGPVAIAPRVRAAFAEPPAYHRDDAFTALFEGVRRRLTRLTNSAGVALLAGGGTLANEAVAATLAAGPGAADGLVLVNGEFGGRLHRQAARWGLRPRVLEWPWGRPWDPAEVAAAVRQLRPGGWVWGVHHETSTGVLNDLPGLVRAAEACGVRVCVDAVSSVGAVPVDLAGVYLGTATAGKALGAYAGLAMVFADPRRLGGVETGRVPEALDLPAALAAPGPRFTVPSPCVRALDAALDEYATPARFAALAAAGAEVRGRLRAMGARVLADEAHACPVLTTFAVPAGDTSPGFVRRCARWGFRVAGQSEYLAARRLAQVATMGVVRAQEYGPLLDRLARLPWGEP